MANVSNMDDVIDSRDVIAHINELENKYNAEAFETNLDDNEEAELLSLKTLAEEASGSPDWPHGETLIRATYFETYAQELAEDIGAINSDQSWPNCCIDWEKAAYQLQMDYTSVEFDGVDYWIRS